MTLAATGRKIALAFEPWQYLEAVAMILYWITGWFVVSVVVFFRKDFGERYLSWLNLFFGYLVVGLFAGPTAALVNTASGNGLSAMMIAFYLAFIGLSVWHRYVIRKKNMVGVEWHSLYSGTPLLPVPVSLETMNKWVEPAMLLVVGMVTGLLHLWLICMWLVLSAFALALHEQISCHLQRQRFLDMRDAGIEAKYWQAALSGKPAQQSRGFVIAASNLELMDRTPGMRDVFAELAPDVRAIMDRSEAA